MNPDVRALFPGARGRVYLDVAAKGLVPSTVREQVRAYVDDQVDGTMDKARLRRTVEETRTRIAALVGADADEVAVTKNVSEGVNLFAASLPWASGDNVVICPDLEHPNNIYPWYNLRRRLGVEVRAVPAAAGGELPVRGMIDAMDERTRVVTFSTVSSVPGLVGETRPIVDAAHDAGALALVDAAQSVGALDTDVHARGFDAVAMTAQKCLLSFFGCGFLYVRRAVADQLAPVHLARYGVDLDAPETAHSDGPLRYRSGALRFDLGNYNYLGVSAVAGSLDLIEEVGTEVVEAHVRELAGRLAEGLLDEGMPVIGDPRGPGRAHIVTLGFFTGGVHEAAGAGGVHEAAGARTEGAHETTVARTGDGPDLVDLHRFLNERGIVHSLRNGMLRFSVGLYNDATDVERVLEGVRRWRRGP